MTDERVGEDVRARLLDVLTPWWLRRGFNNVGDAADDILREFPHLAAGPATEDEGPIYSETDTANVAQLLGLLETAKKHPTVVQHLPCPNTPLARRLWDVMDPRLFGFAVAAGPTPNPGDDGSSVGVPVAAGPAEPVADIAAWWIRGTGPRDDSEPIVVFTKVEAERYGASALPLYFHPSAAPSRPPAEPVTTVSTDSGLLWRIGHARDPLDSIELSRDDGKTWVGVWGEEGSVAVTLERIRAWARLIALRAAPSRPVPWRRNPKVMTAWRAIEHSEGAHLDLTALLDTVWQSAVAGGRTDG